MVTIRGALKYPGDPQIFARFPLLDEVKLRFDLPVFQYQPGDGGTARTEIARRETVDSVKISAGAYSHGAGDDFLVGGHALRFFEFYRSRLQYLFIPSQINEAPFIRERFEPLSFRFTANLFSGRGAGDVLDFDFHALPLLVTGGYIASGDANLPKAIGDFLTIKEVNGKIAKGLVLLNYDALLELLEFGTPDQIVSIILHGLDADGNILDREGLRARFVALNTITADFSYDTGAAFDASYGLVEDYLAALTGFPVPVEEIQVLDVAGAFSIKTEQDLSPADFTCYELSVGFDVLDTSAPGDRESVTWIYDWKIKAADIVDNTVAFAFRDDPVLLENFLSAVTVGVRGFDGVEIWSESYAKEDPRLGHLKIAVPRYSPPALGKPADAPKTYGKRLRGQVVDATGKNAVKNLTVVVQAKAHVEDELWRIVGSATTDNLGNFNLAYPKGVYAAAQALVSTAPDSPADIPVRADADSIKKEQTIDDGFVYLLLTEELAKPDQDDCDCKNPPKANRLPDQEDLIESDSYTQDIGGACLNLSTPNRTLSEFPYYAIVRTSDPDVANYTLQRIEEPTAVNGQPQTKVRFVLSGGTPVKRQAVAFDNPIRWQDDPGDLTNLSFYQAVSVAHGHILHFKTVCKADGYSLGELLYSLPLAPGQKKQIVINDMGRTLEGGERQQTSQGEMLAASLTSERTIADVLAGSVGENLRGSSNASTAGVSVSAGASYMGMANIGVSGGYSTSSSDASQDSARNIVQNFSEKLRTRIQQNAQSYRQNNAAVVTTVSENQRYSTQVEVVANHNHCHSLTMMYFEVLRHYAIYQELTQVEECLFVPLLMTHFTRENIYKWRDVLAANLLDRPSSTYLPPYLGDKPLVRAFDANERIMTDYANVDYPTGGFHQEVVDEVVGELYLRIDFKRPNTNYDRIKSWPIVEVEKRNDAASIWGVLTFGLLGLFVGTQKVEEKMAIVDQYIDVDANFGSVPPVQSIRIKRFDSKFFGNDTLSEQAWTAYANLLGITPVYKFLDTYFRNRLVSEWDDIYYGEIAPKLVRELAKKVTLSCCAKPDVTVLGNYYGGEQIMRFNLRGSTSHTREAIKEVTLSLLGRGGWGLNTSFATLVAESLELRYSTQHYHGYLFSGYLGDDLSDSDSVTRKTPCSSEEKRNPRAEDRYLVAELINHLNSNLEHYNKALWRNLDPDRRYMLLDGFHIQVYDDLNQPSVFKSLASVVRNETLAIVGNSLVLPVAPGYKLDRSYIVERRRTGDEEALERIDLFDHYKPTKPTPPYRVSVPTRGVFCEAVQGACNACEKIEEDRAQDWTRFTADEPTPIGPVSTGTPSPTDWKANYKDFAPPIVNIQNAPTDPAPAAGLAALTTLMGQSGLFKDITGLDANQKNAMATYLSNQENARAMAELASKGAMQNHNTQNSDKIMKSIRAAKDGGAITDQQYQDLVKKHLAQQIDGGKSQEAEAKAKKDGATPSLTQAAVDAAKSGKKVKAEEKDTEGNVKTVEIGEGGAGEPDEAETLQSAVLAEVPGPFEPRQQEKDKSNGCWATAATMLLSWKRGQSLAVADVLREAGGRFLERYEVNARLSTLEKAIFLEALGLVGEPPANYMLQQYIAWMETHGPLWVTIDAKEASKAFSPHAWVVTKIAGANTPDGKLAYFTYIDPADGEEKNIHFPRFVDQYQQIITDAVSASPYVQVVHFGPAAEKLSSTPRKFKACKEKVYDRGIPPDSFLNELINWAREAPDEIFAQNDKHDIYESVEPELGPWRDLLHRKAAMCEVLRVLGGFESSWNWREGIDRNNPSSATSSCKEEAGIFQCSGNSMSFDASLKNLLQQAAGATDCDTFIKASKANHRFAIEYCARLIRFTVDHHGPIKRKRINPWLRTDAVSEFEKFLSE